jgi:hypothetical protein
MLARLNRHITAAVTLVLSLIHLVDEATHPAHAIGGDPPADHQPSRLDHAPEPEPARGDPVRSRPAVSRPTATTPPPAPPVA